MKTTCSGLFGLNVWPVLHAYWWYPWSHHVATGKPQWSTRVWFQIPPNGAVHSRRLLTIRKKGPVFGPSQSPKFETNTFYRRKFRTQTSDIFRPYGQMGKQRWEESERRREEETRSEKGKSQKKEDAKVDKPRITMFFPMVCGSGGSKSRLAKAAGAEPSGQMRDQKLHAVAARSTFRSQNAQNNTSRSEHFWKLRCR